MEDVADELYRTVSAEYECPRCGRSDLPLYFFHEHNRSCAFECAIGGPALDEIERLKQRIEELEEKAK